MISIRKREIKLRKEMIWNKLKDRKRNILSLFAVIKDGCMMHILIVFKLPE